MSKLKLNPQRGDTIIEVLLAMSVIGLVIGASFGIANRSVRIGQDAQERSEALKLAETQVELFKVAYKENIEIASIQEDQPFCLQSGDSTYNYYPIDESICKDIDAVGNSEGLYSVSIIPPGNSDPTETYEFKVKWLRLGASNKTDTEANYNNLSLYYKPGSL